MTTPGIPAQRSVKTPLTPNRPTVPAPAGLPVTDPVRVLGGVQAQGDLIVLPWPDHAAHLLASYAVIARPLPACGVVLAVGAGGHAHTLLPDGPWVALAPDPLGSGRSLAVVFVSAASTAVLAHDEHADLYLAPGIYAIRRQRQASPRPDLSRELEALD